MVSRCLAVLVAATAAMGQTPEGFTPASDTSLIVDYRGVVPLNGTVVSRNATLTQPRIGTLSQLTGTSYAVMMIDLDIPTANPPETDTLLHWMQTGLTPATTATQLNTTAGTIRAFLLENSTSTAPIVPYFGPNPPARIPLSHRYTQILVDTSGITEEGMETLREAAATIRGFNAESVLRQAGLESMVVAGNSYNVTNPGPVGAQTGGNGAASGTGAGTGSQPTGRPVTAAAVGGLGMPDGRLALAGGLLLAGVAMLGL